MIRKFTCSAETRVGSDLSPEQAKAYRVVWCEINRASMLRASGRYDEAIRLAKQAIVAAEVLEPDGYADLGWCRYEPNLTVDAKHNAEATGQPSEL